MYVCKYVDLFPWNSVSILFGCFFYCTGRRQLSKYILDKPDDCKESFSSAVKLWKCITK